MKSKFKVLRCKQASYNRFTKHWPRRKSESFSEYLDRLALEFKYYYRGKKLR